MKTKILLTIIALALTMVIAPIANASAPVPPDVEIYEYFDYEYGEGFFSILVENGPVYGFAVENGTAEFIETTRPTWAASIVAAADWDNYLSNNNLWADGMAFGDIFGMGATQALVYHQTSWDPLGYPETDDRFYFGAAQPESIFITFNDGQNIIGETVVVPEPISSTLFVIGAVALGFRQFRKIKS